MGKPSHNSKNIFVVGIGASAGGLEPMQDLFHHASCHGAMCFVIGSHVPRYTENDLARILGKASNMKTLEAQDQMQIETCTLYTIPPDRYIYIEGTKLRLMERPNAPVNAAANILFSSLARAFGKNSIGVVLSGAAVGEDGSEGLCAIKEAGGHTYVQTPDTAQFRGMPEAAIRKGCADSVLDPEQIGHELSLVSWAESDKPDPA